MPPAIDLEYKGRGSRLWTEPRYFQLNREFDPPEGYLAGDALSEAVNTALFLEQPLLLTGAPGTGKTQLAYSVAWEFDWPLFTFHTKSTSTAKELFYSYDSLQQFHDISTRRDQDIRRYLRFNALGQAILASNKRVASRNGSSADPSAAIDDTGIPVELLANVPNETRSVVLIDEIDKAPRDFPNDILHEMERLAFEVTETSWPRFVANRELQPLVVLTSNLEKSLPDAFLRRCIFYYITPPDKEALLQIARRRLGDRDNGLHDAAVSQFITYRDHPQYQKPPGTAEMLGWIKVLRKRGIEPSEIARKTPRVMATLYVLLKTQEDLRLAGALG
jgi:MoxR-like ATPase